MKQGKSGTGKRHGMYSDLGVTPRIFTFKFVYYEKVPQLPH